MNDRHMILGMYLGTGYGSQATAWRAPGVHADNYTNLDAVVRHARAAERASSPSSSCPTSPPSANGWPPNSRR